MDIYIYEIVYHYNGKNSWICHDFMYNHISEEYQIHNNNKKNQRKKEIWDAVHHTMDSFVLASIIWFGREQKENGFEEKVIDKISSYSLYYNVKKTKKNNPYDNNEENKNKNNNDNNNDGLFIDPNNKEKMNGNTSYSKME